MSRLGPSLGTSLPLNLFGRARKLLQSFGPAEPPKPQHYSVACAQGHRLHGLRVEGYQALRCPTCGDGVFVLPRSPLPDPPAPGPPPRPQPAAIPRSEWDDEPVVFSDPAPMVEPALNEGEAEADIEWIDEQAQPQAEIEIPEEYAAPERGLAQSETPARPPRGPRGPDVRRAPERSAVAARTPRRPGHQRVSRARGEADPGTIVPDLRARPTEGVAEPVKIADWFRKHRLAVVFLGVAVIVVATVAIRIRQRRRQELPLVAEVGRIEGLPALDQGDFDTAHRKLSAAARAVRAMGGQYEGGDVIVQGADEAAILIDLVPTRGLEEIMDEAARAEDEKAWQARFNDTYKGRTIFFDGNMLKYRMLSRRGANNIRVGRIETTGIRLLESAPPQKGLNTAIYGARLASLTLEKGEWVVRLDPESVVVMTHWKALQAANLETEENKEPAEESP